MQDPGAWLVPLSDSRCLDAALVGGKAAQLHRLADHGFRIPDAWVVTQTAFAAHFGEAGRHDVPARPVLQNPLGALLADAWEALTVNGDPYLAVRSSALGEDGVDHSFAGQHATYYYIDADSLGKAVIDCWLSLWSSAALTYRSHVATEGPFGMAVIIQIMVQAERSGVCFTRDPVSGRSDQALIEATWGLGAALVDGRVSPDRYRLDTSLRITERRTGNKRLKVAEKLRDPDGPRLEPVPAHQRQAPVLSDAECRAVLEQALNAERCFGIPQDMEWAFSHDEFFVLQSRPITALPSPVNRTSVQGRWVLFKPLAENVSEPLTPMSVDIFRRVLPPFGQFIRGRYYLNADAISRLLPLDPDDAGLRDLLLLREPPSAPRMNGPALLRSAAMLAVGYLTSGIAWHRTARVPLERLDEFADRCDRLLADAGTDALATMTELFLPNNPLLPIGQLAFQVNISAGRYFILLGMVRGLLERFAPDFDQRKLGLLTSGGDEMLSQQMVEAVRALAVTAESDTRAGEALTAGSAADVGTLLDTVDEQSPFRRELEAFLERYGHRAIREIELMTPRWREDPIAVLQMVRNLLKPAARDAVRTDPHGLRLATEDELHQALPRRWQRRLVDRLLGRVRYYVTARENTRYYHTMAFAAVRAKLKEAEQRLIVDQRLRCEDDVFFLLWPELTALEAGALEWSDVEQRILERRRRYRQSTESNAPETFNFPPAPPRENGHTPDTLRGDCASPGVAEGRARVISDPAAGVDLEPGEILVAPYTDPAWTPLFPGAAAVVVEVGSYLSHAGTVAREYQIPCLVDVPDCTRRIRTGARLKVNADEGWVQMLDEEEEDPCRS